MLSEVPITLWPIAEKISHELEIAEIFSLGPKRKTHHMQQMHNGATNHILVLLYNRVVLSTKSRLTGVTICG